MNTTITAYLANNWPFGHRLSLIAACDCTQPRLWRCETLFLSQYVSFPTPHEICTYQAPEDYVLKDFISEDDFLTSCVESLAARVEAFLFEQQPEGYGHLLRAGTALSFSPTPDSKRAIMRLILFGPEVYEPLLRSFISNSAIKKVTDEFAEPLNMRGKIKFIRE